MKKGIFAVGGILVVAAAAGGIYWFGIRDSSQNVADGESAYVSSVSTITGYSSGTANRYAGVIEPQETVEVKIESDRKVTEVQVEEGQEVKQGQLLFEYDLSSIQQSLQEQQLALDRLKNEALSLQEQISTLENEKKQASQDSQLSYTIEIETNRMNLQKNQYDQKSTQAQIDQLQNATANTEVRSEIDGVIQKIDTTQLSSDEGDSLEQTSSYDSMNTDGSSGAFITILSTGAYRVKGYVNEQNIQYISEGVPVIIRSRVDEEEIWRGTVGVVDRENATTENSSTSMYSMDTSNSQTTSSTYPFYVELDSSDGLMLGQHVYIELDNGQEDQKEGLWLSEFMIVDADSTDPYVWAADENGRLEKREVILGQYDESLSEYEIVEGLSLEDSIAYPAENLQEGMTAISSDESFGISSGTDAAIGDVSVDMEADTSGEVITDMNGEIVESDTGSDLPDEELVPIEDAPGSEEAVVEDVEESE